MENQPEYPNFKKVQLEDKKVFDQFAKFPSYSDFSLLSLLSWNSEGSNSYSRLNNNLVLKFKDYLGTGFNYSILGSEKITESVDLLLKDYNRLSMVPEVVVTSLENPQNYKISEDRDNFDYIVSIEKLCSLSGKDFKPLRRYVHTFARLYPKYEVKALDVTNKSNYESVLSLTKSWVKQKNFDAEKVEEETKIISLFMDYSKYFKCDLLGLYVDGKLVAYTFNERFSDEVVMGHFGKADNTYEGASYLIEYETSKYFYDKGFTLLNHEQDTGILGLRETKLTYRPIYFLKKYTMEIAKLD